MSAGTPPTADDLRSVDQLEEVWTRIATFAADLSEAAWKRPTEVPGWSVQDNLTHITDVEARLLERPRPEHHVAAGLHVRNPTGANNELFVDARRSWRGVDALAEFVEVTRERIERLRASTGDDFAAASWTPVGAGTVRDLLPFRVFDSWVHEQDMRRAVGRPGGLDGPAAEAGMDLVVGTAGYVVGKKVSPPDGTVVVVECGPPLARTFAVEVDGGRARPLPAVPAVATVRIRTTGETYARVACGRLDPLAVVDAGGITFVGDDALGRAVVEQLNFLF